MRWRAALLHAPRRPHASHAGAGNANARAARWNPPHSPHVQRTHPRDCTLNSSSSTHTATAQAHNSSTPAHSPPGLHSSLRTHVTNAATRVSARLCATRIHRRVHTIAPPAPSSTHMYMFLPSSLPCTCAHARLSFRLRACACPCVRLRLCLRLRLRRRSNNAHCATLKHLGVPASREHLQCPSDIRQMSVRCPSEARQKPDRSPPVVRQAKNTCTSSSASAGYFVVD